MEMICDTRTCAGWRYLENEQDDQASFAEFVANCQHAKCKVVRLVRQQISKLQNTQYERYLNMSNVYNETQEGICSETSTKVHEAVFADNGIYEALDETYELYGSIHDVRNKVQQVHDEMYEMQKMVAVEKQINEVQDAVENMVMPEHRLTPLRTVVECKWMLRVLNRIRHRAYLILTAAAIGVIVWSALVYGVFLGATFCGNSRTCFASSFKYTKRSLF